MLSVLSWVVPKCQRVYPHKREAEGGWMHTEQRAVCRWSGEKCKVLSLKIGVTWPQTKASQRPPAVGRGKEQVLPRALGVRGWDS